MRSARLDTSLNVMKPALITISPTYGSENYPSLAFGGGKFFVTWVYGSPPYTLKGQILVYDEHPVAVSGADQSGSIGQMVSLDGSASHDPDSNLPLTYSWSYMSRPTGSVASITNPSTATLLSHLIKRASM